VKYAVEALNRSHFATGTQKHRDPRFPPFAFTEYGAIMAATILNSPRAVEEPLRRALRSCNGASSWPPTPS
jgi:hypothetical protein